MVRNKEGIVAWDEKIAVPPMKLGGRVYRFSWRDFSFLQVLIDTGMNLEEAMKVSRIDEISAEKILKKPGSVNFLNDRIAEVMAQKKWTVPHWFSELDKVWEGEEKKSKNQVEVVKELGSRVVPKVERIRHEFQDVDIEFIETEASQ